MQPSSGPVAGPHPIPPPRPHTQEDKPSDFSIHLKEYWIPKCREFSAEKTCHLLYFIQFTDVRDHLSMRDGSLSVLGRIFSCTSSGKTIRSTAMLHATEGIN